MGEEQETQKRVSARVLVSGRVQRVGFRAFSLNCARALHLAGLVQNLPDGRVSLEVEGARPQIEALMFKLRQGPPRAQVEGLEVSWREASGSFEDFAIVY